MPAIMADNDCKGQFAVIQALLESDAWRDLWSALKIPVVTFEDVGLPASAPDAAVWQACQERQIVLVTGNRNAEGADSLEATIRTHNEASSLPVITVADPKRLMKSRAYAEKVVERLMDILLDLDNRRGTGRLFVP